MLIKINHLVYLSAWFSGLILSLIPLTPLRGTPANLEKLAQDITVRIEGRSSVGTGVFVERQGKVYYILTNAHVVKNPEIYTIFAPDKKCYLIDSTSIKSLPNLDLAVLPLNSASNYRLPQQGNSQQIQVGETVFVSGWTYIVDLISSLIFFSSEGQITDVNSTFPLGYSITYTNLARAGMSGGPVLDTQGRLVAINGLVRFADNSDSIVASGIGINNFVRWRNTLKKPLPVSSQMLKSCPSQRSSPLPLP